MIEPRTDSPDSRITVELAERSYEIEIHSTGTRGFGPFVRRGSRAELDRNILSRALIVTDGNVAQLALPAACAAELQDAGIAAATAVVPPGESSKSLDQARRLYDALVDQGADRHTLIVALGGGVVGDLAGFVAATFHRGLPLIMVPTTLLAQVDSSVGGKVGINHPRART